MLAHERKGLRLLLGDVLLDRLLQLLGQDRGVGVVGADLRDEILGLSVLLLGVALEVTIEVRQTRYTISSSIVVWTSSSWQIWSRVLVS